MNRKKYIKYTYKGFDFIIYRPGHTWIADLGVFAFASDSRALGVVAPLPEKFTKRSLKATVKLLEQEIWLDRFL